MVMANKMTFCTCLDTFGPCGSWHDEVEKARHLTLLKLVSIDVEDGIVS